MADKILHTQYIELGEKMMQTVDFTEYKLCCKLPGKYFSVLEKNKPPNLFLRRLKILPLRTTR